MSSPFDSSGQLALFALGQTGFFARFNLAVLVNVALQGLKILVVEVGYVGSVFENFCHFSILKRDIVEVYRLVAYIFDNNVFFALLFFIFFGSLFSLCVSRLGNASRIIRSCWRSARTAQERNIVGHNFDLAALLAILFPRAALQTATNQRCPAFG